MSMAGTILVTERAREAVIEARVIRCGCGEPAAHIGSICPRPRRIEDRGAVAYWHKNPLRRLAWRLARMMEA